MTGESVSQLISQSSILIFQLIHHEQHENLLSLSDRKLECASILTSFIAIFIGLSTYWLSKRSRRPRSLAKLRLSVNNLADVALRLALALSLSVFAMQWMYGVVVLFSMIAFLWLSPFLLSCQKICKLRDRMASMDRSLVLVPMARHQDDREHYKSSRIRNKKFGLMVAIGVIVFEILCVYGFIPIHGQDSW